jgi:hypothetical protein
MTVDNPTVPTTLVRIALLRSWLSHRHDDEPFWWARQLTAPRAQADRERLRVLANLLHVERATDRNRLHGTRFATLDEQRAWLASRATIVAAMRGGELAL